MRGTSFYATLPDARTDKVNSDSSEIPSNMTEVCPSCDEPGFNSRTTAEIEHRCGECGNQFDEPSTRPSRAMGANVAYQLLMCCSCENTFGTQSAASEITCPACEDEGSVVVSRQKYLSQ